MAKLKNIAGCRYGILTVLNEYVVRNGRYYWKVRCDCGETKVVQGSNLKLLRSCGCIRRRNVSLTMSGRRMKYGSEAYSAKSIIAQYRRHARCKGLAWDLTDSTFQDLCTQTCHYCGHPPGRPVVYNVGDPIEYWNGLDRKVPRLGYTTENVVAACWICNRAKGTVPYSDFLAWVDQLVVNRASQAKLGGPK